MGDRKMKREFWIIRLREVVIAFVVLGLIGCASIGLFDEQDQASKLKSLKRGKISGDGSYTNDFYEFELRLPKGWSGTLGDPPTVLHMEPQDKSIDANVRRFVSIDVIVNSCQESDTLEKLIEQYTTSNRGRSFEVVSQRDAMTAQTDARVCIISAKSKDNPLKIMSLITKRDTRVIILECSALRPLFDNVEAFFSYAISSFRTTSKGSESQTPTPTPKPFDREKDYFNYTVEVGDTFNQIAQIYMGSETHAAQIRLLNQIDTLTAGQAILIPRTIPYVIVEGDTFEGVAQRYLYTSDHAAWLKEYNDGLPWEAGQTIQIPLYNLEAPLPREGYWDLSKRVFGKSDMSDLLNIYNDGKSLNALQKVRLPFFLFKFSYTYTVRAGDTLAKITAWATGDPKNLKLIADFNKLKEPYNLTKGQIIEIPRQLVKDPSIFDRLPPPSKSTSPKQPPKPKPTVNPDESTPPREGNESAKSTPTLPTSTPSPRPTSTPVPMDSRGIYEPD